MDDLATVLLGLHGPLVYGIVTLLVFLESAALVGLVVPGETALLAAGALAAHGTVSLPVLLGLAVTAAVLGDSTGYLVGRRFGPGLRASRLGRRVGTRRWASADRYLERRGPWAVVVGRWVGFLRALVPPAAGMSRMPYRRVLAADLLGSVGWAAGVLAVGYAAGGSTAAVSSVAGAVSTVTGLAVVAAVAVLVVRALHRRSGARSAVALEPATV